MFTLYFTHVLKTHFLQFPIEFVFDRHVSLAILVLQPDLSYYFSRIQVATIHHTPNAKTQAFVDSVRADLIAQIRIGGGGGGSGDDSLIGGSNSRSAAALQHALHLSDIDAQLMHDADGDRVAARVEALRRQALSRYYLCSQIYARIHTYTHTHIIYS